MSVFRDDIVESARGWIGTPYRHQAALRGVGCDCLGLVRGVWHEIYGSEPEPLPAYSPSWAESGLGETLAAAAMRHLRPVAIDAAEAGDVMLFRWRDGLPAKHCAILTAPHRLVHAHDGATVAEIALSPWWRRHRAFAFAFPEIGT